MFYRKASKKAVLVFIGGFGLIFIGAAIASFATFVPLWVPVILLICGFWLTFTAYHY